MWVELTSDRLLAALSGPERNALNSAALGDSQSEVLAEIAVNVAAEWRAGLRRITTLDLRPLYVPGELLTHILADFRYRAFTRLPNMATLLDDLRVDEWKRANQVRDNLQKISVEAPDPDYAESPEASGKPGPAIADPDHHSILGW